MIKFKNPITKEFEQILSQDALHFISELHDKFEKTRVELLQKRENKLLEVKKGSGFKLLKETDSIRLAKWSVAPAPLDLMDRRVEITGPVEAKMMVNALNSGANVFMADLEDSLSPTWENVVQGQINLFQAVRSKLTFTSDEGKFYSLKDKLATLVVRPRGWHLEEKNILIQGKPVSASLFDFGLYFYHNAQELIKKDSGPYFYLPKMESHLEARLWNDVFNFAQKRLYIPQGTIRATVLIETLPAAFEMEEILYELREHASGLNAGRWDYIFSMIKKFAHRTDLTFPDRSQLTMTTPFMDAYTKRLVCTCHRRGAHAIGGMAAFIPSRKNLEINAIAIQKVREDKLREVQGGFDGTWVAHPDLVKVAKEVFDEVLLSQPHQKLAHAGDVLGDVQALLPQNIEGGELTTSGFVNNVSVCLQYISAWLSGQGAVGINNLMEDAATAEISRAQLWQWVHQKAKTSKGVVITPEIFKNEIINQSKLLPQSFHLTSAGILLKNLVLSETLENFLTIPAYELLNKPQINQGALNEQHA